MDNTGQIEIRVSGTNGNIELNPDNYDIREIIVVLESAESLLCPNNKQSRPTISYNMLQGSVRHVFTTSMQYVIGFNAIIGQISQTGSIDFLDNKTASAIETLQKASQKKSYAFEISTSLDNSNKIKLDAKTAYLRKENVWVDAEFYFYGQITNAGGKDKANIHIATEELGTVNIQTPIDFLEQYENNILYKKMGIHATGKQHLYTNEIETASLKFVELVEYSPTYDERYLSELREKAKKSWPASLNADDWINEIRGRA